MTSTNAIIPADDDPRRDEEVINSDGLASDCGNSKSDGSIDLGAVREHGADERAVAVQRVVNQAEDDTRRFIRAVNMAAAKGVAIGFGRGAGIALWDHVIRPLIEH